MKNTPTIILASTSPRRRELLASAGVEFTVVPSHAEEVADDSLPAADIAMTNARLKAQAVEADHPDELVIGADTVVALDGHVYGKPRDDADAQRMLSELSGQTHVVITGVSLVKGEHSRTFAEQTLVTFKQLSPKQIAEYVATGEPADKDGAYGIQGLGGALVNHIEGDYNNVVGLPADRLLEELAHFEG